MTQPTEAAATVVDPLLDVTLANIHTKNVFELRQWLEKTNRFDAAKIGNVTHDKLMHFGMQILTIEKDVALAKKVEEVKIKEESGEVETLQARLARQKAERMAAAVERSKQRQQDPAYFAGLKEQNEELKKKKEAEEEARKEAPKVEVVEDEEEEEEAAPGSDDPFRQTIFQRSKIGGAAV
jgi:hypothetical protein